VDYSVCVKDCPDTYEDTVECYTNDKFKDCNFRWEDVIGDPHPVYGYLKGIYPSDGYIERICLPDSDAKSWTVNALDEVNDYIDTDTLAKWLGDVWRIWYMLLIVAGIAVIIAGVYLFMLRWCLGIIVWLSIFLIFAFLLLIGGFCHWSYENQFDEENDEDTRDTLEVLAIVFYVLAGVFLLYILWMCNKIRLAIAIMKAGTVFIKDVWTALLVPPVFFIVGILIFAYWVVCSIYIYSTGDIEQEDDDALAEIEWDDTTRNIFYFHFFAIYWVVAFILAFEQFVLASTVCLWYYS